MSFYIAIMGITVYLQHPQLFSASVVVKHNTLGTQQKKTSQKKKQNPSTFTLFFLFFFHVFFVCLFLTSAGFVCLVASGLCFFLWGCGCLFTNRQDSFRCCPLQYVTFQAMASGDRWGHQSERSDPEGSVRQGKCGARATMAIVALKNNPCTICFLQHRKGDWNWSTNELLESPSGFGDRVGQGWLKVLDAWHVFFH